MRALLIWLVSVRAAMAAPLFDDLGDYHRKISSPSERAQRYFDQGLRLVYAFNHDEAERSFAEAARLDPSCAICDWGVALVLGPNINMPPDPERTTRAYETIRRAQKKHANERERALIDALANRYSAKAPSKEEQHKLDVAYADAMREVHRKFPDDLDAATLFAEALMDLRPWKLWTHDGKPEPGTEEILATLESVLARAPNHPGANHYYIHALEGSPHPERALAAADRVGAMMPGAGHLVHMPSHAYMRVGRYADASEANRRAILADEKYVAAAHPRGSYSMYVAHNHQFLWATAMMEGHADEAIRAARAMLAVVPPAMFENMPEMSMEIEAPALALIRFGRWTDVLSIPAPPAKLRAAVGLHHFARARALVGLERFAEAERELAALAAAQKGSASEAQGLATTNALLAIAADVAQGMLAAHKKDFAGAISALERAVANEDALPYNEPPDWYYPVRHTLGAVLLDARKFSQAEAVYREDLRRHPHNGWALAGLAAALRAQNKSDAPIQADLDAARFAFRVSDFQ